MFWFFAIYLLCMVLYLLICWFEQGQITIGDIFIGLPLSPLSPLFLIIALFMIANGEIEDRVIFKRKK